MMITRRFFLIGSATVLAAPRLILPKAFAEVPAASVQRLELLPDVKMLFEIGIVPALFARSEPPTHGSSFELWRGDEQLMKIAPPPWASYRWVAQPLHEIVMLPGAPPLAMTCSIENGALHLIYRNVNGDEVSEAREFENGKQIGVTRYLMEAERDASLDFVMDRSFGG